MELDYNIISPGDDLSLLDFAESDGTDHPAMLLGQLGVDKKYRGKRIGSDICNFCLGLADVLGKQLLAGT